MNIKEFSASFDTLINSYAYSNVFGTQDIPIDTKFSEYEKSVFLTQSEKNIVESLYNNTFEGTEEIRRYLSSLVKDTIITDSTSGTISSNSQVFTLPENLWFITYESGKLPESDNTCLSEKEIDIIPVTQDDFHYIKRNPFKGPSERRALRLDINSNKVEIVSKYPLSSYFVRYVEKVSPIVLVDLEEGLNIDGVTEATECTLHEGVHPMILSGAVELAVKSLLLNKQQTN